MKTPIDDFLSAQSDLSAVERFARTDTSSRTDRWSELIPLSQPTPGHQFRFEVDLDQCTGCKACVTACHNLNGLDIGESFRSIGVLVAEPTATAVPAPAQQTVTTACHHCADPGCLNGCPAEAYEKDPITGIVKHLDDACIGCRYCTLTCPYEVPVYNHRLGIVRKCDMCADRLADGEAPACVQGCPTQAISITTSPVDELAPEGDAQLVPGAAPSILTMPTTSYRGRALETHNVALDSDTVEPQHAHLPLVVLLVLSQSSVGVILAAFGLALAGAGDSFELGVIFGAVLAVSAVVASVGHLGQPRKAWRVMLGWSHSWLSREAIVLGMYLGVVLGGVASLSIDRTLGTVALGMAVVVGLAAVFCSVMIYVVTGRTWWQVRETSTRFFGTVLIAASGWLAFAGLADDSSVVARTGAVVLAATVVAKLVSERRVLEAAHPDLQRTSRLLRDDLAGLARLRASSGCAGALLILAGVFGADGQVGQGTALALIGVVLVVIGEISERRLFFTACAPLTMPGAHR